MNMTTFKISYSTKDIKSSYKRSHGLRQYNVYMHELLQIKRKKDESIYSPLEKWMTVKKQITDSETLIANKMLNLTSSEGNSNKTMKCWV